jgi:hypothetical protein
VVAQQDSTIRRRHLGLRLRSAMHDAGWNGKRIADWLGQSESVISRLLSGHRPASPQEISAFLAVCRVQGDERDALLALCGESSAPDLFQVEGESRWAAFREHAGQARRITAVEPAMVPWVAQVAGYTRAVAAGLGASADDEDAWTGFRMRLADPADRPRPTDLELFVHESALRTPVGGAGVMSEQLHNLLRLSVLPAVSLRVVPLAAGAHPGMAGGFTLLEFEAFPPAVYREDGYFGAFVETPAAIARCRWAIGEVNRVALDGEASRDLLRRLAVELYA